jgi:hypothetical protein
VSAKLRDEMLGKVEAAALAAARRDLLGLKTLRDELSARADVAEGWDHVVLELTQAAVDELARVATNSGSTMAPSEMALRHFLSEHADLAYDAFETLLAMKPLPARQVASWPDDARRLLEGLEGVGVLTKQGQHYFIVRGVLPMVRDVIEPPVLRSWRLVKELRERLSVSKITDGEAAHALAAQLGLTDSQAMRHMARFPTGSLANAKCFLCGLTPAEAGGDEAAWALREGDPEQAPDGFRLCPSCAYDAILVATPWLREGPP